MEKKRNLLFLTILLTLVTKMHLESYYCGVGTISHSFLELPISNKISKTLSDSEKNEYKPIRIYVDTTNFKDADYKPIFESALEKCIETLQKLIKVKPLNYKFFLDPSKIDNWGYKDINENITNSSIGLDTDLLVLVKSGKYAYTGNSDIKYMDKDTSRPIVGTIEISTQFYFEYTNGDQYMKSLLLHQFTHILGFLYDYF